MNKNEVIIPGQVTIEQLDVEIAYLDQQLRKESVSFWPNMSLFFTGCLFREDQLATTLADRIRERTDLRRLLSARSISQNLLDVI